MAPNKNLALAQTRRSGFTLTELAISLAVASVAVLVSMTVGMQKSGQMSSEKVRIDSQDNARIALDEITRMLRGSGSQVDYSRGQKNFVFAAPYTVAVNANLFPIDDSDGTKAPIAVDPALANGSVPLGDGESYVPKDAYSTGAETIVITVDSDRDAYVTSMDNSDDEEEDSDNPRDFVVKGFVYGSDGTDNLIEEHELALIRGPVAGSDGSLPAPLFQYWLDDDNDTRTPPVLHGDADSDGYLSASEVAGLDAVPAEALGLIEKIDVTATSEARKSQDGDEYSQVELRSSVTFRNRNFSAARVLGVVFHDVDQNGVRDQGEVPLSNVLIRCSDGSQTQTAPDGRYWFVLPPGSYTVQEVDPVGVSSTTPNTVPVDAGPEEYVQVDFGDTYATGWGTIHGRVFDDMNENGAHDDGETGITGVNVFLDTGATAVSDTTGYFLFQVGVGNYTVAESDLEGYASTTPNVVDVDIKSSGDSVWVWFGDVIPTNTGRIEGVVYLDEDKDGVRDTQEPGIAGVTVDVDEKEFTLTDNNGAFSFTVIPGEHVVNEQDPPAHSSSTLNSVTVEVKQDSTVVVLFGDIGEEDVQFQEITLANTERALSIASLQFNEDSRTDLDVVLGTHYVNGSNDVLAWWNQRQNSNTPNSAIFNVSPSFQRVVNADVNALAVADLNNDGHNDVIGALGASFNNIAVWLTEASGTNLGTLGNAPLAWYSATGATAVLDVCVGQFNADSYEDFAIGTKIGTGIGKLEIWLGSASPTLTLAAVHYGLGTIVQLGEVVSLAAADFNGDRIDDLVVGTNLLGQGKVILAMNDGSGTFTGTVALSHNHEVKDVLALDMKEDDGRDTDIVVATASTDITGEISVWHNRGSYFGRTFAPNSVPNDVVDPEGAPLSLVSAYVDNDIYPDIITGTRNSNAYTGQVVVYRAFGFLSQGTVISNSTVGEVITITTGDYNKDGAPDLATGTRVSASTGKVVVYFNTLTSI
jgi:prepilin-type N-terminal cleavage/methylation domain-containing protein